MAVSVVFFRKGDELGVEEPLGRLGEEFESGVASFGRFLRGVESSAG